MQGPRQPCTEGERVKSVGRPADEKQLSRPDHIPSSLPTTINPFAVLAAENDEQKDDGGEGEAAEYVGGVVIQSVEERNNDRLIVTAGRVGGRTCKDMLVDCGATACFVRRRWAEARSLPITPLPQSVTVTLADSSSQLCAVDEVRADTTIRGSVVRATRMLVLDTLPHDVIIGMPWLDAARVTIGFGPPRRWNGQLLDSSDVLSIREPDGTAELFAAMREKSRTPDGRMSQLQLDYSDVFRAVLPSTTDEQRKNAVHFSIELADTPRVPVKQRERRLTPAKRAAALDWVREEVAAGRMEQSTGEWSAQLVFAAKYKDDQLVGWRICGDYRDLNGYTKADAEPLPLPEEILDQLQGSCIFSKMDLLKGFNQIPVAADSRAYMAVSTPDGLYQPTVMPFGVRNAPSTFQREMRRVLRDKLHKGIEVFVDDIIIHSRTIDEHIALIRWLLQRLRDEHYYAHPEKCEFMLNKVSFLGHVVNSVGIAVQQHKVAAVRDWPAPANKREVRGFLGLAGYYRRFVQGFAKIAEPLSLLTHDNVAWQWEEAQQSAFQELKDRLSSAPILVYANPTQPYILQTDASDLAVGAVLSQRQDDGSERPIAYWSHKLNKAEFNYSATEKELLAIVLACEHWAGYLEGSQCPILIRTDHQPLTWLNGRPVVTARLARWVVRLTGYDFKIDYVKGKENVAADALSRRSDIEEVARREIAGLRSGGQGERVKLAMAMSDEQAVTAVDDKLSELCVNIDTIWDLMRTAAQNDDDYQRRLQGKQEDDKWERRGGLLWSSDGAVWVPNNRELRTLVLQLAHDWAGHFGISRTLGKIRQYCVWDGMTREVEDYCRSCVTCTVHKSSNQRPAGVLSPLPIPAQPWDSIGIDFVGPLPPSTTGNDMIMVVVDRLSKMVLLAPCKLTINAKQAGILLLNMLLPLLAVPKSIVSDRDVRFTGSCWRQMWEHMGTRLDMSTAYHPQTDGQTERTNRTIQTLVRMYVTERKGEWEDWLQMAAAAYNSTVHESTGKTPAEMNYPGRTIDPLSWALHDRKQAGDNEEAGRMLDSLRAVWSEARARLVAEREKQARHADKRRRPVRYEVGQMVYLSSKHLSTVKGKLKERWTGPFVITAVKAGGSAVTLNLPAGWKMHSTFNVSLIKPYVTSRYQWPGRAQQDRVVPVIVDGEVEWEVEAIIGKYTQHVKGYEQREVTAPPARAGLRARKRWEKVAVTTEVVHYLVKWKGYDEVEASWMTVDELINCRELIDEYELIHQHTVSQEDASDDSSLVELAVAWVLPCSRSVGAGEQRGRPAVRS